MTENLYCLGKDNLQQEFSPLPVINRSVIVTRRPHVGVKSRDPGGSAGSAEQQKPRELVTRA